MQGTSLKIKDPSLSDYLYFSRYLNLSKKLGFNQLAFFRSTVAVLSVFFSFNTYLTHYGTIFKNQSHLI